jgi:DNA-binding NarL/FixJ family response regulator
MKTIKIMIAENHPMFLNMLVKELTTENISVIGAALNGQILIDLVRENVPDIVILDLEMPVLNGHGVLEIFAKEFKSIKTIIFSNDYSPYYLAHTIINGARGYLIKSSTLQELIKAVEETFSEGFYFNELLSKEVLFQLTNEKKKLYFLLEDQRFSIREIDIIRLTCEEFTVEQIADRLNISVNTVNDHKKKIFKKTDSNNIISLVKYATKHRIINPEKPDKWL